MFSYPADTIPSFTPNLAVCQYKQETTFIRTILAFSQCQSLSSCFVPCPYHASQLDLFILHSYNIKHARHRPYVDFNGSSLLYHTPLLSIAGINPYYFWLIYLIIMLQQRLNDVLLCSLQHSLCTAQIPYRRSKFYVHIKLLVTYPRDFK